MKKASVAIVLLVAVILALGLSGTALAGGKVAPAFTAASVWGPSGESGGLKSYDGSFTFAGKPYQWYAKAQFPGWDEYIYWKVLTHTELASGAVARVTLWSVDATWPMPVAVTYYLGDRKKNIIATSTTITYLDFLKY